MSAATLAPLAECKVCGRHNRAQQRRGMCHSCYEKRRRAGEVTSLVSARAAREHIAVLRVAGWKYLEIARAAHINRSLVAFIVGGRAKINADTAFAICCIQPGRRGEYIKRVDPDMAKARGRKAAASLTPEVKAERSRKIWETRHANARAAEQVAVDTAEQAEAARQRELFEAARRRAAEAQRQRQIMVQRHAEAQTRRDATGRLLAALGAAVPADDWRADAVCAQTDPDLFFPEKGGATRGAKAVCEGCGVRDQCLQWALDNEERFGIWGGRSERERRRMIIESA